MLDIIRDSWNWLNIDPSEIEAINAFGCVVFRNTDGSRWLIRTDEPSCEMIARNDSEFAETFANEEFLVDWHMLNLVEQAKQKFGEPEVGHCYCLKMPSFLGGEYKVENLGTISREELISFAGDLARQIHDLPDGTQIRLDLID